MRSWSCCRSLHLTGLQFLSNTDGLVGPADFAGSEGPAPAEELEPKLATLRTRFVNKVSDPVLNSLMDKLLGQGVITDGEMEDINCKLTRGDKARALIDLVRKKGWKASVAMVEALCEVDQCLAKDLNLLASQPLGMFIRCAKAVGSCRVL